MRIAFIGAGAMGGAMVKGCLQSERFKPQDIIVSDHNQPVLDFFAQQGVSATSDNKQAVAGADIVCVVVKPWCVEKTLNGMKEVMDYSRQILMVVAAGVPSADIKRWLDKDGQTPKLYLVMPNIAIAYKASMTFITSVDGDEEQDKLVADIFNELGDTLFMEESYFPAATTMSCATAYAMRYIRASMEAGVQLGFKASVSQKVVQQIVKGAVELLQATGEHPESAIDKVTTPNGLTIRGLNMMEQEGFTNAVIKGILAGNK